MRAQASRRRHDELGDGDADQRQPHHQPEDAGDADEIGQDRARHDRNHERGADADADQGHGLGAVLLAGQIGDQRQDHRADRAGALERTADNDAADRGGDRRHRAAGGEQEEADNDHDFASHPVRQQAEGNLQKPLRQPINAERLADQVGRGAVEAAGIGGKDRIDHEQAEQPDGEDCRKRSGGTQFLSLHRLASPAWVHSPTRRRDRARC